MTTGFVQSDNLGIVCVTAIAQLQQHGIKGSYYSNHVSQVQLEWRLAVGDAILPLMKLLDARSDADMASWWYVMEMTDLGFTEAEMDWLQWPVVDGHGMINVDPRTEPENPVIVCQRYQERIANGQKTASRPSPDLPMAAASRAWEPASLLAPMYRCALSIYQQVKRWLRPQQSSSVLQPSLHLHTSGGMAPSPGVGHNHSHAENIFQKMNVDFNPGHGDCFFHANEGHTHVPPLEARARVSKWAKDHHHLASLFWEDIARPGELATETHMDATVQAFACSYERGLILHLAPRAGCILFQPGERPVLITVAAAASMLLSDAAVKAMRYTEPNGCDKPGHVEALHMPPGVCRLMSPSVNQTEVSDGPVDGNKRGRSRASMFPIIAGMRGSNGHTSPGAPVIDLVAGSPERPTLNRDNLNRLCRLGVEPSIAKRALLRFPHDMSAAASFAFDQQEAVGGSGNPRPRQQPRRGECSTTVASSSHESGGHARQEHAAGRCTPGSRRRATSPRISDIDTTTRPSDASRAASGGDGRDDASC